MSVLQLALSVLDGCESCAQLSPRDAFLLQKLLMKMLLHCSDICNPSKIGKFSDVWADRVMKEFFNQGDQVGPSIPCLRK